MQYLINQIVKKGLDSVDFSMLNPELKKFLLTGAGELLIKEGRIEEGIRAMAIADNKEKLNEYGKYFFEQNKIAYAALAFLPSGNKEMANKVAYLCLDQGFNSLAFELFKTAGNIVMMEFLNRNI